MGHFFLNEQGVVVTVNGDRYRTKLNEFLFTIEKEYIGYIWFEQDGATCHTAEAKLDVLRPVFQERIISRKVDVVWLPRSCALAPLDYYLWGVVKDKCYANKLTTIDVLKDNIRKAISEIQLQIDSVGYYMAIRDSHFNEIIFHYYPEGLYFQIKKEIWENIQ